jgi:putative PIN family toxin of toxin-antitoxin system
LRVFLDTNVIVAATATRGLCADVMREVLARHDLLVSAGLLDEVAAVLRAKIRVPADTVSALLSLLRDGAILAAPSKSPAILAASAADRALLSAALHGKAEAFVTGDTELLGPRTIGDMAVVSPRAFWELAKAGAGSPKPR